MTSKRPNILIVVIDSMRWDHVSCYGYHRNTTPNIDRLADEGCLFETCITAAPFSPASYASIFSGLYPHQHGVNGDTVRVWPNHWPRLAEKLKDEGYFTFCISNNSFLSEHMNGHRGFDVFVGPQHPWWLRAYNRNVGRVRKHVSASLAGLFEPQSLLCRNKGSSVQSTRRTADLIQATDRPFFGFLVLMDPHAMFHPRRTQFVRNPRNLRRFLKEFNGRQMWPKVMARRQTLEPEMLEAAIDLYDGEIAHADACVGRLYDTLRDTGQLDNTVFAVTADHGEAFGEHGVWGHGFCLNDCLTRVPLVIRHPGHWSACRRATQLVQLHDLHETCLTLAGDGSRAPEQSRARKEAVSADLNQHRKDALAPHQSRAREEATAPVPPSLAPDHRFCLTQAEDPSWPGRDAAFSEFPVQTGTLRLMQSVNPDLDPGRWAREMWSVRTPDWRLIEYDAPGRPDPDLDLFDLQTDPQERTSCHQHHPDVVESLRAVLAAHRGLTPPQPAPTPAADEEQVDETVLARLRDLGYIE